MCVFKKIFNIVIFHHVKITSWLRSTYVCYPHTFSTNGTPVRLTGKKHVLIRGLILVFEMHYESASAETSY